MPTTLNTLPSTSIKVRWKEPYASEALNKKFAVVIPAGIYRGLRLEVSAVDLSVDLAEDAEFGDHVAVIEATDGNSVTYRDQTSGRQTLSLVSFSSGTTVVVAVSADYQVGADTTAEVLGYTQAEFDALTDEDRRKLAVVGTVLRPASGIIPIDNITHDQRSVPFKSRADEAVPWNPMIRNGSFELGDTNETYANASPFWETSVTNADFAVGPVDTDSNSGDKCLEIEAVSGTGLVTAIAKQTLYVPSVPGRQVSVRLYKRGLQAATSSPVGKVRFAFEDKDGANDTNLDVLFDVTTVDAGFEKFEGIVVVPDNMTVLKSIEVEVSGTYGSIGPCIRIDDVQAWCEVDAEDWLAIGSSLAGEVETDALVVGNRAAGQSAAIVSFDGADLVIGPRNPADDMGVSVPRIVAVPSIAAGIEYTLVWESVPSGQKGYRKYVSPTGELVETVNAWYDNATNMWNKDTGGIGQEAIRINFNNLGTSTRTVGTGPNTWLDSAWVNPIQTLIIPTVAYSWLQLPGDGSTYSAAMENGWLRGSNPSLVAYAPVSPYLKPGDEIISAEMYVDMAVGEFIGVDFNEMNHGDGSTGVTVSDTVSTDPGPGFTGVVDITNIDFNSSTNILEENKSYWIQAATGSSVNSANAVYSSKVTYRAG